MSRPDHVIEDRASQSSQEAQEEVQQTPLIYAYAVRCGSKGKISMPLNMVGLHIHIPE